MNFQSILEELDKLYEELPVEETKAEETEELEESVEEPEVEDEEVAEDDLAEGIFDSKATKQKKYNELIAAGFDKKVPTQIVRDTVSASESLLKDTIDNLDDENVASSKGNAKNLIRAIKNAIVGAKKSKFGIIDSLVSYGTKWASDSLHIEELRDFKRRALKVQGSVKGADKAIEYLMDLVNSQLQKNLDKTIKFLVKEYGIVESLTEEADDEEEIIIVDDEEVVEEQPVEEVVADAQVVLECSKCGALVLKSEADVHVDESTDFANVEEECQYCEEAAGYRVIGSLAPYEVAEVEEVEEEPAEEVEVAEEEPVEEVTESLMEAKELEVGAQLAIDTKMTEHGSYLGAAFYGDGKVLYAVTPDNTIIGKVAGNSTMPLREPIKEYIDNNPDKCDEDGNLDPAKF